MTIDRPQLGRREFAAVAALAAAGLSTLATAAHAQDKPMPGGEAEHAAYMDALPQLTIGLVIFPYMTAMNMVAPQLCMKLMMKTDTHIVAQTAAPVPTDGSYEIVPTMTIARQDRRGIAYQGQPMGSEAQRISFANSLVPR